MFLFDWIFYFSKSNAAFKEVAIGSSRNSCYYLFIFWKKKFCEFLFFYSHFWIAFPKVPILFKSLSNLPDVLTSMILFCFSLMLELFFFSCISSSLHFLTYANTFVINLMIVFKGQSLVLMVLIRINIEWRSWLIEWNW